MFNYNTLPNQNQIRHVRHNHAQQEMRGPIPLNQHYGNPNHHYAPPHPYNMHLQQHHRIVARGPRLTFLEFNGEDIDG